MHRHVPRDVVEDVGLGEIVPPDAVANGDGDRKFAIAEAVEEVKGRHVAGHGTGTEDGQWGKGPVDLIEAGNGIRIELQHAEAIEELGDRAAHRKREISLRQVS